MTTVPLGDGFQIPTLGYGTWRVPDDQAEALVADAIAAGYRHIDTASFYENEVGVGQGIAACGLDRSEVFVTTKLWTTGFDDPSRALESSLSKLGLDQVDLYLIHWPVPVWGTYVRVWEELIGLRDRGLTRSIGVSNFLPEHLGALEVTGVAPCVNQVEVHPSFTNTEVVAANSSRGIRTVSYRPLGNGKDLAEPTLVELAVAKGATPAQVVLSWHLAKGYIPIPKSADSARMRENLVTETVPLTDDEVGRIDALNCDNRQASDPATFAGVF